MIRTRHNFYVDGRTTVRGWSTYKRQTGNLPWFSISAHFSNCLVIISGMLFLIWLSVRHHWPKTQFGGVLLLVGLPYAILWWWAKNKLKVNQIRRGRRHARKLAESSSWVPHLSPLRVRIFHCVWAPTKAQPKLCHPDRSIPRAPSHENTSKGSSKRSTPLDPLSSEHHLSSQLAEASKASKQRDALTHHANVPLQKIECSVQPGINLLRLFARDLFIFVGRLPTQRPRPVQHPTGKRTRFHIETKRALPFLVPKLARPPLSNSKALVTARRVQRIPPYSAKHLSFLFPNSYKEAHDG